MTVDHRGIDELEPPEAAFAPEHLDPGGREPPVDVVIVRVNLPRAVAVHRVAVARIREDAVRLDQHPTTRSKAPAERPQQPDGRLDPVKDPAAEDEVECLVELVEVKGIEPAVLDSRVEQPPDRPESLGALELDSPAGA